MGYVEFPNLGNLKFEIDRVAINLFGMPIYWYGVIIASSFLISVLLLIKSSKKYGILPDNIIDILLFATPAAIICARLYYVVFNLKEFNSFGDVINIRSGGLAIYGGIIGAFITVVIVCKINKLDTLAILDVAVPYIALAQAIGRWGNFINQEAFGTNTNLPWAMTGNSIKSQLIDLKESGVNIDPNLPVHPTFLYESLWNILAFFVLIKFRNKNNKKGAVLSLYMIIYGIGRFFIEGLRMDSLMIGTFRVSQLLAAIFIVIFGIIFYLKVFKKKNIKT
jgi:phosphatidylglycerol:prolipoprotein diacylglycerol transferase